MWRALLPAFVLPVLALATACADEDLLPAPTPRAAARATTAPTAAPKAVVTVTPKAMAPLPPAVEGDGRPATRTPEAVPAAPSRLLDPALFPENLAVVVQTVNCWNCGGGPVSIVRAYRDPAGDLRVETLLHQGYQPPRDRIFLWRTVAQDRSGIATTSCEGDGCLGLYGISAVQQPPRRDITVHRSLDGGVTWSEGPVAPGKGQMAALVAGEQVVLWESVQEPATRSAPPAFVIKFYLFPSGDELRPPAGMRRAFPVTIGGDYDLQLYAPPLILWGEEGVDGRDPAVARFAWLASDGAPAPWQPLATNIPGMVAALRGPNAAYLIAGTNWWGVAQGPSPSPLRAFTDPGLTWRGAAWQLEPGPARVNGTFALSTVDRDIPPAPPFARPWPLRLARLNLDTGDVQPYIAPELEGVQLAYVLLAYHGPFARAVRADACTEVRSGPSSTAAVLECAANGVLFQRSAPPTVDGAWLGVTTPAGATGWTETRYLEW